MKTTDEPAWRDWVKAVCDAPDFLMRRVVLEVWKDDDDV